MKNNEFLVLTSDRKSELLDFLFERGFDTVVADSINASLRQLKKKMFSAIIVDSKNAEPDLLEFILNVRDRESGIPIIVLRSGPDQDDRDRLESGIIRGLPNLYVMEEAEYKQRLPELAAGWMEEQKQQ